MKERAWGPFRLTYGRTRQNEKTVAVGIGKVYSVRRFEWRYFIGFVFWAVYVNIGIKKGWWKKWTG